MQARLLRTRLLQSFNEIHSLRRHRPSTLRVPAVVQGEMQRRQKAVSSDRTYKHTHSYLQILGNGTDTGDTTPSVLLFFDAYRYVFNVGEGFQRYCFQHRLKLGKLQDIFLTRMSTEAAGGVPGLFITLSEFGVYGSNGPQFNLHGPLKLDRYLKAIQTFVSVPVNGERWTNFGSDAVPGTAGLPLVSNSQVEIRPILLSPEQPASTTPSPFLTENDGQDVRNMVPAACYVCQLAEVKGKFLPEKARALGVRMGPDCAKLVDGESVTASDGSTVFPHQVMEPTQPGPIVIIVDCPDASYASCLFSASGLAPFKSEHQGHVVMVHLGPFEVVGGAEYAKWINALSSTIQHIFVNERAANATAIMRQATVIQSKLNLVDAKYFPLPQTITPSAPWEQERGHLGQDLLRYHLKPLNKRGPDDSQLLGDYSHADVIQSFKESEPAVVKTIEAYKSRRESERKPSDIGPEEIEITFLGTGSAVPSKYRNVTGIYLDFFERGSMMLDCGEGSYGQLIRRYGKAGAQTAIQKLKCLLRHPSDITLSL